MLMHALSNKLVKKKKTSYKWVCVLQAYLWTNTSSWNKWMVLHQDNRCDFFYLVNCLTGALAHFLIPRYTNPAFSCVYMGRLRQWAQLKNRTRVNDNRSYFDYLDTERLWARVGAGCKAVYAGIRLQDNFALHYGHHVRLSNNIWHVAFKFLPCQWESVGVWPQSIIVHDPVQVHRSLWRWHTSCQSWALRGGCTFNYSSCQGRAQAGRSLLTHAVRALLSPRMAGCGIVVTILQTILFFIFPSFSPACLHEHVRALCRPIGLHQGLHHRRKIEFV